MELTDLLRQAPLVAAAAWFLLAILQVYRDRFHTWTEVFFLATCYSAGFYGYGDWLFFNTLDPNHALLAARIGTSALVLGEGFFLLFSLIYVDRMRRSYWLFLLVSAGMTVVTVTSLIPSVAMTNLGLFRPEFATILFSLFLAYVVAYGIAGIWSLYRLHKIMKRQSEALARRTAGLLITFTLVLVLGIGTNGLLGYRPDLPIPPPFSTLLIFVAGSAYYTLYPGGRERVSEAVRRFQSRLYRVQAAFLIYKDGTLIGAESAGGEMMIDKDLFSATLDVIQNFMQTSFPAIRGMLHSLDMGESVLVIERAKWTYVALMIRGESTDQLRRFMRDGLLKFEEENQATLATWRGVPNDAKGVPEFLFSLLAT